MRHSARYKTWGRSSTAAPPPDLYIADRTDYLPAAYSGQDTKVDLASLFPGGMTQDAEPGVFRLLHASSPEPVIGHGGTKAMIAEGRRVLYIGTQAEYQQENLNGIV
jgi:hypothetical protein